MADVAPEAGHVEKVTLHLTIAYPPHLPREHDPHYHVFNQTRDRLKRLGALKCWIGNGDCAGDIELHHNLIEDALINDIDRVKFALDHPQFKTEDDAEFLDLVQGEGNLLALCRQHHIGTLGIHALPYPVWNVQKYLAKGVAAPARMMVGTAPLDPRNRTVSLEDGDAAAPGATP